MSWNSIEANWHQLRGSMREKFAKLTDDDLLEIGGKVEAMVGKLQERYNLSLEEAKQIITGLKGNDKGEMELETSIQGEGNVEASRRFQDAQHEFAAGEGNIDGGRSTGTDVGRYDIATEPGDTVTADVSKEDVAELENEHKRRTENYINR